MIKHSNTFGIYLALFIVAVSSLNNKLFAMPAGGGGGTPCIIGAANDLGAVAGGDECFNVTPIGALDAPCACDGATIVPTQIQGTTIGAVAEMPYVAIIDCEGNTADQANPAGDVWYSITMTGQELNIDIIGMNQPNVGIYEASGGCGALVPRGCAIGAGGALSVNFQNVFNGETIYIQVSGEDEADVGDFTMTLSNNVSCVDCILADNLTVSPAPVNGTYQPGETVSFCYAISNFSQENTNWLHGVVPVFGAGWDLSSLAVTPPPQCASGTIYGTWSWFTNISTPNDGNVDGFFFDYTSSPTGDPTNNFGDNCEGTGVNWNFCWDVTTSSACAEGADLGLTVFNYSDGETGSWDDVACQSDPDYSFSAIMTCCQFPLTDSVPACPGMANGSATITGQGASPWDYTWSTGESQNNVAGPMTISNLVAGTYRVTVVDNNGCIKIVDVFVTELPLIVITPVATPASCAVPCDGAIDITVTGGATPYAGYLWSNGATSEDLTLLCGGAFTVTVTDAAGCTMVGGSTVITPPLPTVTASTTTNETCDADCDGSVTAATVGGTGTIVYTWNSGIGQNQIALCDGTFAVTVSDDNGCTSVSSTTVTPGPLVTAVAVNSSLSNQCLTGNSYSFDASGSTISSGAITGYNWNFGDATFGSGAAVVHTYTAAATYTATVTVTDGICYDIATIIIVIYPQPTVTLVSPNPNCAMTTGEMTATGAGGQATYSYSWSGGLIGASGASQTQNNVADGAYTVTLTDGNGCSATAAVTVTQPPALTVTQSCTDETAPNSGDGTTSVSVSGGQTSYSYNWSNGAGNISSQVGLPDGTYTVTITDGNACTIVSSCVVNPIGCSVTPAVTMTDVSCNAGSDGTGFAVINGSLSTSFTYAWSGAGGASQSASNLIAGGYSVTITDGDGCSVIGNGVVNQPTAMTITSAFVNVVCFGDANGSIDITLIGGTPGYTYLWGDGPTIDDRVGIGGGTYTVTATDASVAGCTISTSVVVVEPTQLVATITPTDVTCNAAANGQVNIDVSGGTSAYSFLWSNLSSSEDLTSLGQGTFTVTITDAVGCTIIRSAVVNEPGAITITTSSTDANCGQADGSVSAGAVGGAGGFSYAWPALGPIQSSLSAAAYTVTVTDANGCTNTAVAIVNNIGGGTVTLAVDQHSSCAGVCDGQVTATMTGGTTPYGFLWSTSAGTNAVEPNLCVGTVNVTVTDAVGCIAVATTDITEPAVITSNVVGTAVICPGACDGTSTVSHAGGTTPFSYLWNDPANQTGIQATNLCAGTSIVTMTDANGCTLIDNVLITQPPVITVTITAVSSNCNQADGALSAFGTGGNGGPFQYVWSNAATGATASNLVAAAYPVTVTDVLGCTSVQTGVVTDLGGGAVAITINQNVSCFGVCDGQATATMTGGSTPYSFAWSSSANTGTFETGLCVGAVNVTVTDGVGCIAVATNNVTEPTAMAATAAMTCVSSFGATDGTVTVSPSGGTSGYTFVWSSSGNPTTQTVNNLAAGPYTVTVTDLNGCTIAASTNVCSPTPIIIVPAAVDALCNGGQGSVSATASGGVTPYTYQWFNSAGASVGTTPTLTGLLADDYYVAVTDQNLVTVNSSTVTVGQPTAVTLAIASSTNILCNGNCDGNAQVSASGGTSPFTYSWTSGSNAALANNLCTGPYMVTVLDVNNCPATIGVTITQPAALAGVMTSTSITCFGANDGTANYAVSGGVIAYTYLWSNTAATSSLAGLAAGVYCVTVTDQNSCLTSACVTITEPSELVLSNSTTESTCSQSDGSATALIVSGNPVFTYQWDGAAGNQTSATASGIPAGNYVVTVTDGSLCTAVEVVAVTDAGAPTISILSQQDVSCFNGSDGLAQVSVSGGATPLSYQWNDPLNQITSSATALPAGIWSAVMTDGNNCIATINVQIDQPTQLLAVISNTTDVTCFGSSDGTATVLASGGTSPYTYQWNDANTQVTAVATGLSPTSYAVAIIDANLCNITLTTVIGQPTQILLTGSSTPAYCNTASGSACPSITNGVGPFSYLWEDGQVDSCGSNFLPGPHIISVTDIDGCMASTTITVGNLPPGVATITNQANALCFGGREGSATVSMSGATAPFTYLWSNGDISQTATGLSAGTYCVTVTDANTCEASVCVSITEPADMANSLLSFEATCKSNDLGTLEATTTGGTSPYTYAWSGTLLDTDYSVDLAAGSYTVTISDVNGCTMVDAGVITQPSPLVVDSNVVNSNCLQNNGAGCVTASGGASPYTYNWGVASTTTNSCILSQFAGTYYVTVTDDNLCEDVTPVVISDINGPTALITPTTDVSCFGGSDGSATVIMIGGTGGIVSVDWTDATSTTIGTSPTVSNLVSGQYTAQITDGDNCVAIAIVDILEPTDLTYVATDTDPTCFGFCDGTITISIFGGTTPYSTTWSTGDLNTNSVSNLCGGNYSNTLVDANGCTELINYTLVEPVQLLISVTSNDVNCFGGNDGNASVAITQGTAAAATYQWDDNPNFQTSAFANGLVVGLYTVSVTDVFGCVTVGSTLINEPGPIIAQISAGSVGHVVCNGGNDGYYEVQVLSGGTPPYSYFVTGGQITAQATALVAGVYETTVTDANACQVILQQVISQPPALSTVISPYTDITCYDACDGTATVLVSGGKTPYFYQWNTAAAGQTSPQAINICANPNVCVTVTDATGECKSTACVALIEPPGLSYTVSVTDAHCDQFDGAIYVNISGGVAPYLPNWDDPTLPQSTTVFNVHAGTYGLQVLDANGCVYDSTLVVYDIDGPSVTLLSTNASNCNGDANGVVNFSVSGGTPAYDPFFVWIAESTPNQDTLLQFSNVIGANGLEEGEYCIHITDAAGCLGIGCAQVTEPTPLVAFAQTSSHALCFGSNEGAVNVQAAGGNNSQPYSYSWNTSPVQTTQSASGLTAGVYTVVVTDFKGCTIQVTTTVTQPSQLVLNVSATPATCNGDCDGTVDANISGGSGPYNPLWNPFSGPNSLITNLCAGPMSVTFTDVNGCAISGGATVIEPTVVDATITSTQSTCSQCNATAEVLNVTGGNGAPYTYAWNVAQNTALATNLCAQGYNVVVSDILGCTKALSVTVTDLPSPSVDITFTEPLCYGENTGSATAIVALGGASIDTYTWTPGNQITTTAVNLVAGTYTVVITDANGCTDSHTEIVTQPNPFSIIIGYSATQLCAGQSAQIWATPTGGDQPYQSITWGATVPGNPGTSPFIVTPPAGAQTCYDVSAIDNSGCTASDNVCINVTPPLSLLVPGQLEMCIGNNENICATASGGTALNYTFIWSTGDTVNNPGIVTSCMNVTPTDTTMYYIIVTDGCTSAVLDSVEAIIHPLPPAALNSDIYEGCPPLTPIFGLNLGTDFDSSTVWLDVTYDSGADTTITVTAPNANGDYEVLFPFTYPNPGVYSAYAHVTSKFGCVNTTLLSDYITVYPEPDIQFTASPQSVTQLDPIVLMNGSLTIGIPEDSLVWTYGDGEGNAGVYYTQHAYQDTGTYWILLQATNEYGCLDIDSLPIVVTPDVALYTPNGFTPNGDGLNDKFFPKGIGLDEKNFEFLIFDRWGEIIFRSNSLSDPWDGTARAKGGSEVIKTGVYIWMVKAGNVVDREEIIGVGHVSLLK